MKRILSTLTATLMVACGLALVAPASASASTTTVSFGPVEDTFVTSLQPTSNFYTSTDMRSNGNPEKIMYLTFQPSNLPDGSVGSVVLHGTSASVGTQTVSLYTVPTLGDLTTVTYNTRPALGTLLATSTLTANGSATFTGIPFTTPNSFRRYAVTSSGGASSDVVAGSKDNTISTLRPQLIASYGPTYGTDGSGDPKTSDCTTTVSAGGNINTAITAATAGNVICVSASDDSTQTVTLNKAVTVRATGIVKIKNAVLTGGSATLDGFTIVGGTAGNPVNGVLFSGDSNLIENNLINGHVLQYGVHCTSCGTGTVIDHNTVAKINNYGIFTANGTGITISNNNIYDLYDTVGNGLDVDGARIFGTNHVVKNNYLHDLNKNLSTASVPHEDCFQNYQNTSDTDIASGILYENNYCLRVSGMFLILKSDTGTTHDLHDYTIRGNVAETYGWQQIILSGIQNATVENNSLWGATQGGPNITVENNPDSGLAVSGIRIQNDVLVRGISTNASIGDKDSNPPPTGSVTVNTNNDTWVDTSLVTAQTNFNNSPTHQTTAIVSTDFTDYVTRTTSGANVVDAGATMLTSGLVTDANGNVRIQGSAVDIGAYEIG